MPPDKIDVDALDYKSIDPEEMPYIYLVGSQFTVGRLEDSDSEFPSESVIIEDIYYLPYNAEPGTDPRQMKLVINQQLTAQRALAALSLLDAAFPAEEPTPEQESENASGDN